MRLPSRSIAVPLRITKKSRVLDYAAARGWSRLGEAEWHQLQSALPDVSESVMQQCGLPVDAPWCGVRQHTFEELADSLLAFSEVYESRPDLRTECRRRVIEGKDRARFLIARAATDEATRERKAAMVEWMLIWLGDPAVFPVWLAALNR